MDWGCKNKVLASTQTCLTKQFIKESMLNSLSHHITRLQLPLTDSKATFNTMLNYLSHNIAHVYNCLLDSRATSKHNAELSLKQYHTCLHYLQMPSTDRKATSNPSVTRATSRQCPWAVGTSQDSLRRARTAWDVSWPIPACPSRSQKLNGKFCFSVTD